ncbi:hypothetical protein niasHT_003178 [Heterodera trifolii]|uniref:Uncharacterized protein n=1 Tax=Heterodera trifolii TaxID=157864 RepID=A0ABD2MB90_9BILA
MLKVQQIGIAEALCAAIERLAKEMQLLMARNIELTGGNALFPNKHIAAVLLFNALLRSSPISSHCQRIAAVSEDVAPIFNALLRTVGL